uniref:tRNA methyltransferase O n=1 Tax=Hippocampus comes TaxID=109280 RepID=A0A3Q2XFY6_HIPCM
MASTSDCCGERVDKLKQQVFVMRKEIKNLRQMLNNATRAHRKHMLSIESAVSKVGAWEQKKSQPPPTSPQTALEHGNDSRKIQTLPIGYIHSCFTEKNGTPRQPTICGSSRAELQLEQSVFNNPEHALVGLEQFSHIWVIFLFHKNGHLSHKAKVKPPRLNGKRVGLYSTRSPHRPNALGLTLAKLDKIVGPSDSERPRFRFLRSSDEAAAAIRGVLSADPRSVYRRTRCKDKLFFFTLDTADITCWFGPGFAEVLQIQPVQCPVDSK